MASLVSAIFDEYSTLNTEEKAEAVAQIGENVSFDNFFGPSGTQTGTGQNDVFFVDSTTGGVTEPGTTSIDIVVASVSVTLPGNVEHLILTGNNSINGTGNDLDNVLAGNLANNVLDGGAGDDLILGGAGKDTLIGGDGDDKLEGGSGADNLDGGDGDDIINGGSGADVIDGGAGDDNIDGGTGADTITAGSGDDIIEGGAGADVIYGGDGDDDISGGSGADFIDAGAGTDEVTGGSGADVFFFGSGSGLTIITDFVIGADKIEVDVDNGPTFAVSDIQVHTIADILAAVGNDGNGNASIDLGNKTVVLQGVDENDVNAGFFHIV